MDEIPRWLPNLIFLEDYKGNWKTYIDAVHDGFHNDFVKSQPVFRNAPVFVRYHPAHEGKGATFGHIISEGDQESERIPDMRRCESIRWPKSLIENAESVKVWETIRPWKNQKQRRINLALGNFSYLVVIAERNKGFDLVAAYPLEKMARREKLRTEFEKAQSQKKRAPRCKWAPNSFYSWQMSNLNYTIFKQFLSNQPNSLNKEFKNPSFQYILDQP